MSDNFRYPAVRSVAAAILTVQMFAGIAVISAFGQSTAGNGVSSPTANLPERLSDSFASVAKKVEPAVVSIEVKGKMPDPAPRPNAAPDQQDDIMDFFRRQMPRRPQYSVGSGFIVDKTGHIMTNAHVVEDAAKITVKLDSGEEYPATVVGSDRETDLAVLRVNAGKDLPFVKLGNSDRTRVGEWVLGIGSPFGLDRTVTAGIISQTRRETPSTSVFQRFIQTDAAINRGNSGGPLVNMDGEVIGVISQIATTNGSYNGVGFALPSTEAVQVYEQILKNGKVRRGYMGIGLESVRAEYAAVFGLKEPRGAIVLDIRDQKGAAAAAGLKVGDVIVEFDGKAIENAQDLITKVAAAPPEQTFGLIYMREGSTGVERRSTTVRLAERPGSLNSEADAAKSRTPENAKADPRPFGLTLTALTSALAAKYRVEGYKGVLVTEVNPESFIADVKVTNGSEALEEGDLIQRINRTAVTDPAAFANFVKTLKKGDPVVLHVISFAGGERGPQLKIVQFTVQ